MSIKARQAEDEPDYLKELLAQAGIDAQASSVAAKLQEVVIGELHHRVKNTLAIVSAIVSQSLKTANSLEEATKTIEKRLHALGVGPRAMDWRRVSDLDRRCREGLPI